jgi:hypothetical protein
MKWGDNARDFDTVLAAWPNYRPLFDNWLMQELVEQGDTAPIWRGRRVPAENGRVRGDVYLDREAAMSAAATLNQTLHNALLAREMDTTKKHSLQLKVAKNLQSKERLHDEEELMLAEARRRHASDPRPNPSAIMLSAESEAFRQELSDQLSEMPYLKVVMVGDSARRWHRSILYLSHDDTWSKPYMAGERSAAQAMQARITELHATGLRGSQGGLGVLRDGPAHGFSDRCDDVDRKPVRIRHVRSHKVHAAFLEA